MVKNTEVLMSKVIEGSETNWSNIMFILIEDEEEKEVNECFDECFDYKVLDLRRKVKREVSLEQMKKRKFMVGYHLVNLNVLPSNY